MDKAGQRDSPDLSINFSSLGFGGWALGGEYWGPQDHGDSVRAVHRALHWGVTHFDTAPVYGKGRSEQLLGQQLKKIRSRCTIATKAFYTDPDSMEKSLKTSLKRLLTDYADIFYIHWPLGGADMRPGMERLEQLRREGRIRAVGVSNFSVDQIRQVRQAGRVDFYQGGYSLLWPRLGRDVLPYCRRHGIGIIPYGVLAQGLLTEKGPEKLQASHQGFRHKMLLYGPPLREALAPLLATFRESCRREGWSPEHAAAAYAREETGAACLLMGVRSRKQADRNFSLPEKPLPAALRGAMEAIREKIAPFLPNAENMFGHKS